MSKAVLVMDMPRKCIECPFCYKADELSLGDFKYQRLYKCLVQPEDVEDVYLDDIIKTRKHWCPFKPMPEKKERPFIPYNHSDGYSQGYVAGWNCCVDAISR